MFLIIAVTGSYTESFYENFSFTPYFTYGL